MGADEIVGFDGDAAAVVTWYVDVWVALVASNYFLKIPDIFFLCFRLFKIQWPLQLIGIIFILLMLGFDPQISGVGSDHSTNWANTSAHSIVIV